MDVPYWVVHVAQLGVTGMEVLGALAQEQSPSMACSDVG